MRASELPRQWWIAARDGPLSQARPNRPPPSHLAVVASVRPRKPAGDSESEGSVAKTKLAWSLFHIAGYYLELQGVGRGLGSMRDR